jgi:hypothetical protein
VATGADFSWPKVRTFSWPRTLTVEGTDDAVSRLFIDALEAVANDEDAANGVGVPRHQHIEYLGESDNWRPPDSVALIIESIRDVGDE